MPRHFGRGFGKGLVRGDEAQGGYAAQAQAPEALDQRAKPCTVYAKSGLIYEYASEDSGKVFANKSTVRTWLVSKIKDRYENSILFKYKNDRDPNDFYTQEFAPLRIDYTDHPDAPATRSVQFVYETTAARELFARGMKLKRSLKLRGGPTATLSHGPRFP